MESEKDNVDSTKVQFAGGPDKEDPPRIEPLNIYQRLHRIRSEVQTIEKAGKHKHFAYAKHDDVTATLAPLYLKYGVDREVSITETGRIGSVLSVRGWIKWVNIDSPDDCKQVGIFAEGVDVGFRNGGEPNIDGLAVGKAISYAVKIAELKNFCLVGESAPDNERAAIGAPPPAINVSPSSEDYKNLKQLYESCGTEAELTAIRKMVSPLVLGKALSQEQIAELSRLDHEAKGRMK